MENKFVLDKEKGLFYGDEYLCGYIEVIAFIRDSEEKTGRDV